MMGVFRNETLLYPSLATESLGQIVVAHSVVSHTADFQTHFWQTFKKHNSK